MPTRWRLHPERIDRVDGSGLMGRLASDVADDMRMLVPKDKQVLVTGIDITLVTGDRARIESTRPGGGGGWGGDQEQYAEEVPYFVEFGTRHSRAQPYMRPAVYRRRG